MRGSTRIWILAVGVVAAIILHACDHPVWAAIILLAALLIAGTRTAERKRKPSPRLVDPPREATSIRGYDPARHPMMHGTPGGGLGDSPFGGERSHTGAAGEQRFASLLAEHGVDGHAQIWFSLNIPGFTDIDVDCAILSDRELWLVDVKLWRAGMDRAYTRTPEDGSLHLRAVNDDGTPGGTITSYPLKRTMNMAAEAYGRRLPGVSIHTVTVLAPTDAGYAGVWEDAILADNTRLRQAETWITGELLPRIQNHDPANVDGNASRLLDGMTKGDRWHDGRRP